MQDPTGMVWEEISCPLCGHGDEGLLLAVAGEPDQTLYRLVRCRRCGMGYVNPRPAPASMTRTSSSMTSRQSPTMGTSGRRCGADVRPGNIIAPII